MVHNAKTRMKSPSVFFLVVRLKGRFFYRMVDDSLPQWIRTYPEDAAPRTGDGLFPGEVIEVTQVPLYRNILCALSPHPLVFPPPKKHYAKSVKYLVIHPRGGTGLGGGGAASHQHLAR